MKTLLFFLFASSALAQATPAPPVDPIQAVADKVVADTKAVAAAQAKIAGLVAAQADLAAIQAQLAADRAALNALLDPLGPTPGPGPGPVVATVSILAVTDTATCAPCVMLQPDLDALKAAGVPVTYLSGSAPEASSKWGVSATPTLIMLVNGVEPGSGTIKANTRIVGFEPKVDAAGKPVIDTKGHQTCKYDIQAWWQAEVTRQKNKAPQ